eukprot:g3466.t1
MRKSKARVALAKRLSQCQLNASSTVSASPGISVPQPSLSSVTGNSSSLATSMNKTSTESMKTIYEMQARLVQWRFLNAKARATFAKQEAKAKNDLISFWHHTEKRRERVSQLSQIMLLKRNQLHTKSVLEQQQQTLHHIELLLDEFAPAYEKLIHAIRGRISHVALINDAMVDPVKLLISLEKVESIMSFHNSKAVTERVKTHLKEVSLGARETCQLHEIIDKTCKELEQWRQELLQEK